jgi:hypothetical protein
MRTRKQTARIATIATVFAVFFAGALTAQAGETLVGKVPFEFTVGKTTFPAGEYKFEVDRVAPNTVSVSSMDRSTEAIALSRKAGDAAHEGAPVVNFSVDGGQRFLSMIQLSSGVNLALRTGSSGHTAAIAGSATSVALVAPHK